MILSIISTEKITFFGIKSVCIVSEFLRYNRFFFSKKKERISVLLTAKNDRVQAYLNYYPLNSTTAKQEAKELKNKRFELFKKLTFEKLNRFITELFTKKQLDVLDEILYLTSRSGVWKISMNSLAKKANCSPRTVGYAVKKLKSTDQFIVARLGDRKAGIYVFIDKLHKNFSDVMEFIFKQDATQFAYHFATLENPETLDTPSDKAENQVPNDNNSFNPILSNNLSNSINSYKSITHNNKHVLKQTGNENDFTGNTNEEQNKVVEEKILSLEEQKNQLKQYAKNEYQEELFNFICSFPKLPQIISDNAYKIALALGDNATNKDYFYAKKVISEMIIDVTDKKLKITKSVRAYFIKKLKEKLQKIRQQTPIIDSVAQIPESTNKTQKTIPFYNWLDVRESETTVIPKSNYPEIYNGKNIVFYNWLEPHFTP